MQKRDRNAALTNPTSNGKKARRGRKAVLALSAAAGAVGVVSLAASTAKASTFTKANNVNPLNTAAAWTPSGVPGDSDIAQFSSTYQQANATSLDLGGFDTWSGIQILNPGNAVTLYALTNSFTLSLDHNGIDMSAATQNLQLNNKNVFLSTQQWNVLSGRTLAINGNNTINNGATITTPGNGTILFMGGGSISNGFGTYLDNNQLATIELAQNSSLSSMDIQENLANQNIVFLTGLTSMTYGGLNGSTNIGLTNATGGAVALTVGGLSGNETYTGIMSGTGSFSYAGGADGSLLITQNNTYTGVTNISGTGTLQIGNGGTGGNLGANSTGAMSDSGTLLLDVNKDFTINNPISGGGSITTNMQSHNLVLSGANTLSGTITVGIGDTLVLGNTNAVQNAEINYNSGNLSFGTLTSAHIGGFTNGSGTGQTVTVPATLTTLTLGAASDTNVNTYLGSLVGGSAGASLIIADNAGGVVQFGGPNTFSGSLNVATGTAFFGSGGTTGYSSNILGTISDTGTLVFNLSSPLTINNTIVGNNGNLTIRANSSTVTLTASNSFSGITTFAGGGGPNAQSNVLQLGNAFALGMSTFNFNTATGTISFGTLTAATFGGMAGSQPVALANTASSAVALSIGNNNNLNTYTGVFSGGGSLNKIGTGVQVLTGNSTFVGGTTVTSGQLTVNNGNALGAPTSGVEASILANATLAFTGSSFGITQGLNLTGNDALVMSNVTTTIAGNLTTSTAGTLTLSGNGTLQLTGANPSFSDAIAIGNAATGSVATLVVGNGSSGSIATLGTMGGQNLTDNGTLNFDLPVGTATMSNGIVGTGNLVNSGLTTTLILTGSNTYTGNTTITQGIIQLGSNNALGNGASNGTLNISAANSLDMHGFGATVGALAGAGVVNNLSATPVTLSIGNSLNSSGTFTGIIENTSGAVSIAVGGTGTLALTGTNTYSGTTTINSGVLQINNLATTSTGSFETAGTGSLGNTSLITIGNGSALTATLEMTSNTNMFTTTTGVVLLSTGSTIQVDGGGNTLLSIPATTFELDGVVSGSAATSWLNKTGNGTLILTGNNTYAGSTIITAGTLQIGNGTSGSFASLGSGPLTDSGTLAFDLPTNATLSVLVSGTGGLTQASTNTLTIASANNTYTGDTIVQAGTLLLGNSLGLQNSTLNYNNQGGVFSFGTLNNAAFGDIIGSQNLGLTNSLNGAVALIVGTNNRNQTYNGNFSDGGAGGSLTKVGTGVFTETGTNGYTGGTFANEGILDFNNSNAYGSASPGSLTINAGGSVSVETGTIAALGGSSIVNASSNGALALVAADNGLTINEATLPGTGMSIGAGPGGMTFTGTITPSGGTYLLGGGATLTLPNTNAIAGSNGLTVENGGTVALTGVNNYTGVTTILGNFAQVDGLTTVTPYVQSTLSISSVSAGGSPSAMGAASNAATNIVINGGDLSYAGAAASTDHLFTVGSAGATLTSAGSGPISFTNTGSIINATQAPIVASSVSGTTVTGLNTAFLQVGMTVTDGAGVLTGQSIVSIGGNSVVLSATASGPATNDSVTFGNQLRNLTLNGNTPNNILSASLVDTAGAPLSVAETAGSWTLAGTNTYHGATTFQGGELGFSSASAISPNTTLNFQGGVLQVAGPITSLPSVALNNATFNGGFDIVSPSTVFTFSPSVSGTGQMIKTGLGTLVLTGTNTFTGNTTISEGTLKLDYSTNPSSQILGSATAPVILGGGTLTMNGSASNPETQNLAKVTLASGPSTISVTDSGQNTTLNLGQFIPTTGASALFSASTNSTISIVSTTAGSASILTTAQNAPIGVINTGGTNWTWAAVTAPTSGNVTPLSVFTQPNSGTSAWGGNSGNLDITHSGEMRNSSNGTTQSVRFSTPLGGYYIGFASFYPVFSGGQIVLNTTTSTYDQLYIKSSTAQCVGGFLMTPGTGTMNVYLANDAGSVTAVEGNTDWRSNSGTAGNEITFFQENTVAGMYLMAPFADRGGTALVKDGPGSVYVLTPNEAYNGGTYINGGTWAISSDGNLGGAGSGGTTGIQHINPVIMNGGTLQALATFSLNDGTAGSNDRPIQLGANGGSIDVTAPNSIANVLTVTGVISGPGALNKTDAGTLVLAGTNTYSGGTNINGGTLQIDSSSGRATGTGLVNINNTGTLIGIGTINTMVNVNSGGNFSPGDVGINNNVGTFNVGSMTMNSGGTVDLDEAGGSLFDDLVSVQNALTINSGALVDIFGEGTASPFNSAGTYTLITANGPVSGVGNLAVGDTLGGTSYSFQTVVSGGVTSVQLIITGGSISGVWGITNGGGWNASADWVGGVIPNGQGSSATFKSSPGITSANTVNLNQSWTVGQLHFNNSNGYTIAQGGGGTIVLDEGSPIFNSKIADNLGNQTITAPVQLNTNTEFQVLSPNSTDTLTISGPISSLAGATVNAIIDQSNGGAVVFSGNNSYSGTTTINVNGVLQVGGGGISGSLGASTSNVITDNGTLVWDLNNTETLVNQINGAGGLTQNSPVNGVLILNPQGTNSNSYRGATSILGGVLSIGNSNALSPVSSQIDIEGTGVLDINGNNLNFNNVVGNGTVDNLTAGGNPTITVGASSQNATWGGVITNSTGAVQVVKTGTGFWTLTNTNTFTGVLTVTGGTVIAAVNNAISPNASIVMNSADGGPAITLLNGVTIATPFTIGSGVVTQNALSVASGSATYAGNITIVPGGGTQIRLGIQDPNTIVFTGIVGYNSNNLFFLTNGNFITAGNGGIHIPGTGFGFGRQTNGGIQMIMQDNSTVTANGLSAGNGVPEFYMNLTVQDKADMAIAGTFDMQNSTLTTSVFNLNLNGGTVGVGNFIQTRNPTSPGNIQGGNTLLPNGLVNASDMFLNGGVLEQTIQVGTNAFLPMIDDLSLHVQTGGALFDSNGLTQIVQTPLSDPSAAFIGDGGVQKLDLGTLILSGTNNDFLVNSSYLGPTKVKGGLLELQNQAAWGGIGPATNPSGNIAAQGFTPSITVSAGGAVGFEGGSISGANSASLLATLENDNTGGTAQINLGGLALDPADAAVNIDYTGTVGGAFSMTNASIAQMSIGALSSGVTYTGTITPGASGYALGGGGTLTLTNNNALTGSSNVLAENGGTVQVANTNNYSGTTTIKGVYVEADPFFATQPFETTTLAITQLTNGTVPGSLGTSSNASTNLTLDGGTLRYVGTSATAASTDRLMTITSAGGTLDSSGTVPISFTNTNAFVSTSTGTQTGSVSGNTISGLDTHQLGIGMTVGDSIDSFSGATITGITPNSIILGTNSFGATAGDTITFTNQVRTLTLTGSNTGQNVVDSVLANAGSNLLGVTKSGAGTWFLAGTNTYSGGTTLNAGTLQVNTVASLGATSGALTLNGGTLEALNSITTSRNIFTGTASPVIQVDGSGIYEVDGVVANEVTTSGTTLTGGIRVGGTGKLVLTGSNTYTGTTTINSGATVDLGHAGSSGTVAGNIVDNGTLNFNRTDTGVGSLLLTGSISGAGTVNQVNTGTTTLQGGNIYTGQTSITAGTLNINGIGSLPTNNTVLNNAQLNINANTQAGNISGTGNVAVTSGVVFQAGNFTQSNLVDNGVTNLTGTGLVNSITGGGVLNVIGSATQTVGTFTGLGTVSISGNGILQLKQSPLGTDTVSTTNGLSLTGNGTLDITNNTVVISYTGTNTPDAAVRAAIISGFDGGAWDGHGITSSLAEADANTGSPYGGNSAVGYADNALLGRGDIPSSSELVRFTFYGDTDLNGVVNGDDFSNFAAGFTDPTDNPPNWVDGDFDYNGTVNGDDFSLFAQSFLANNSLSSLVHDIEVSTLSPSQQQMFLSAITAVPEPASLGLLGMAAIGLLPRRKRKQK